jgi:hypothetical protein
MNNKKAHVANGNKNYRQRVFAIRGGSIIKSWDTETYLRTPLSEIKKQLEVRNMHFRRTP